MPEPRIRHFLADDDLTPAEQAAVLERAAAMKKAPFAERPLDGPRVVSVLFDKPTLRTQVSFVGAITGLGGYPMIVDALLAQIGERESIADVARVLGPHRQPSCGAPMGKTGSKRWPATRLCR